jgi:hypothetical protein
MGILRPSKLETRCDPRVRSHSHTRTQARVSKIKFSGSLCAIGKYLCTHDRTSLFCAITARAIELGPPVATPTTANGSLAAGKVDNPQAHADCRPTWLCSSLFVKHRRQPQPQPRPLPLPHRGTPPPPPGHTRDTHDTPITRTLFAFAGRLT